MLRLRGTLSTSRPPWEAPAAARITDRNMARAYPPPPRAYRNGSVDPLSGEVRADHRSVRPLFAPSGPTGLGLSQFVVYLCRVDFDAYARTAVDIVNAPLAGMAD